MPPILIPTVEEWKQMSLPFFFSGREGLNIEGKCDFWSLTKSVERIMNGEICFFHAWWESIENEYEWVTNPSTGFRYNIKKHWTEIEDFTTEAGDIKYVWEKSRFSYLYTVIRYDYQAKEDHADFVFSEILDWIEKNPLNMGPNYKCSQEISLRVLNWTFALYFYKNSEALSESTFNCVIRSILGQMDHVYNNIQFSRKAVRNNHAITETLTLYLIGMLFPSLPGAGKWKKEGKRWFEQEIEYQIAEDGSYLQFSMNYHRVVVQLLTWAIVLSDRNGERFSGVVYERAYQTVNFLYQCQDEATGWLPNYGANDGALFFDLSDSHYRDYRPQLNALHFVLTGEHLYQAEVRGEDVAWYVPDGNIGNRERFSPLRREYGVVPFPVGGYYIFREAELLTFIRCGKYKDRPGHADNLHVDVWWKGQNILLDGGSYKYNAGDEDIKYFSGTASHNTVMLGRYDQMLKGPRFIWLNWSRALKANVEDRGDEFYFEGTVACFTYLNKNIVHKRVVRKKKEGLTWEITDEIINKPKGMEVCQLWHTQSDSLRVQTTEGEIVNKGEGETSILYGMKEKTIQYTCVTSKSRLQTIIKIEDRS